VNTTENPESSFSWTYNPFSGKIELRKKDTTPFTPFTSGCRVRAYPVVFLCIALVLLVF
jgi:hypothetical protein